MAPEGPACGCVRCAEGALEKAGFAREGILRHAQFREGGFHDLVLYSKLRGE
jgi:RimJ/RimL family protein N-acetyltransferase